MDVPKLRSFLVLAEELHFSRAAARLEISQSTLSVRVRDLERELGIRLLERSTRNVALTEAGHRFLAEARTVVATLDDATRTAREANGAPPRVRVGGSPAARAGIVEAVLDHYELGTALPPVSLREGASGALLRDLAEFRLDVCITFCAAVPSWAEGERLVQTRARVSIPDDGRTPGTAVSLAELADRPLVLLEDPDSAGYNVLARAACADAGIDPEVVWISRGGLTEAFRRTGGFTFVTPWAVGFSDRGMRSLELVGPAPTLHLDLVWHREQTPGTAGLLRAARAMRERHGWLDR